MATCEKCGAQINEGAAFCPICGAAAAAPAQAYAVPDIPPAGGYGVDDEAKDAEDNKVMGILSYLGFLCLIPYFTKKESPFAQFHAKQGIILFGVDIIYIILSSILGAIKFTKTEYYFGVPVEVRTSPWFISLITWILSLGILALVVIGIVNAVKGQKKELPLIGGIKLPFLK